MKSSSQENLITLAHEAKENNDLPQAKQYLLEALRLGHESAIVCELSEIYLSENKADQAYSLIKEEPDLFSDQKVFETYLAILKARHFNIEKLQLNHLLHKEIHPTVSPVSEADQQKLMKNFRYLKNITEADYLKLFQLSKENFILLAQSLLLDPSQNFALRLSLCEDLIKLGVEQKMQVIVLGEIKSFIPNQTMLLEKDPIYREVCISIADYLRRDPSKLTLMVGELNIVMGMLYPKLRDYISHPDQFAHDFRKYLEEKKGGVNQKLLDKIYNYLANEKLNDNFN
ncbi:hypothetical protein NR996_03140 [Lactobacillus rodentium]|uniref:Tetratricopeptide repeat protein n=1 Tax=Lactobacillus rodentium TaxID=947835 RepID=A0A2Z6T6H5_9LACO|nr:hypothetical protein [Lactobacillus rodentium]MCR1894404.1 hypothetical protein [Lactobacillus rodentium]GBG04704.1 hypothetical protein LrDSM24759_06180 [Lactobacillus rodentium]